MSTAAFIKRHIFSLPSDQLFTTRELLQYGTRNAVDLTMFKLVRSGAITRITYGVFQRAPFIVSKPSILDVARVKASAFGRRIFSFGDTAAFKSGMTSKENSVDKIRYYVDGSTTSFRYGSLIIEFRSASARKRSLVNDRIGYLLKALWHLGPHNIDEDRLKSMRFDRIEKRVLHARASTKPSDSDKL
ncbi:MAG TPA: DUF6088 family protein [Candidatus Melainabacteria bacterium]|nr:DUF6088 family protein [Candidatus Melainabacteria bacterium]